MIPVAYSDRFLEHDRSDHPENSHRLISILKVLKNSDVFKDLKIITPEPANEKDILNVHSKDMVDLVKNYSKTGGWLDIDTYVCINSYEIARLAAGALLKLSKKIISGEFDAGFALVRPPGHHATRYKSMGFCLFNNVAITAKKLSDEGKRILIFDHDVHHGNGTQDIFYRNPDVMYQSFHLSPHYPGTGDIDDVGEGEGEGYTINLPLPRGCGDTTIRIAMDEIFIPIAEDFKPDIIVVSAGFDSHYQDPLGGLRLSSDMFYGIIKRLREVQNRLVCSLEGGYNLNKIGYLVMVEIEAMLSREHSYRENIEELYHASDRIRNLKKILNNYWNL